MRHLQFVLVVTVFILVPGLVFSSADESQESGSPFGGTLKNIALMPASAGDIPEEHKFFGGLNADESFPAWEQFIPTWQQNFQRRYRLWDDAELAGFTFNDKCQPDCESPEISADVQPTEILTSPGSPGAIRFQITNASLKALKDAGVPEEVIERLETMKGQSFNDKSLFGDLVRELVGEGDFEEFQDIIWEHSFTKLTSHSPRILDYASEKKGDKKTGSKTKDANLSGQGPRETWRMKYRAFCDKWGLPRPRTQLLLLILSYLTVSLIRAFVRSQQ